MDKPLSFLSVRQLATLLDVDRGTVYGAVAAGEIPAVKIGKKIFIPTAKLAERLGLTVEQIAAVVLPVAA